MDPVRPAFVPEGGLDRAAMEALQRDIAAAATFADDAPRLAEICAPGGAGQAPDGADGGDGSPDRRVAGDDRDTGGDSADSDGDSADPPLVAGVDQAFLDDRAVSAVVVTRGDEVVERVHAVTATALPYIPGLLAFREGGPILAAFERLDTEPALALFDGSGRLHYRQAGLATHVGVTLDLPAIGVAKSLLCGTPARSLDGNLDPGVTVPIAADDEVDAEPGTVIGHAVQTRQFAGDDRHVNPVYVSPGHRVGAETAAEVVLRCATEYKLPDPIRLADRHADAVTADYA